MSEHNHAATGDHAHEHHGHEHHGHEQQGHEQQGHEHHNHDHHEPHDHAHHAHDLPVLASELPEGRILTVRAGCGLSGDIMLAGLAALAGLDNAALSDVTEELQVPALRGVLQLEQRQVNNIAGVGCRISLPDEHAHRTLADVLRIVEQSRMPDEARAMAARAFEILAEAEAAVHGVQAQNVTFHEVGALDSILDICLVCRIFTLLDPVAFICSPLPLADGVIHCAHGVTHAPAPAVLRMLEGIPVRDFSGTGETVTPTALCLLRAMKAGFGGWPAMTVSASVISYGAKVFANAPNGAVWALGQRGNTRR